MSPAVAQLCCTKPLGWTFLLEYLYLNALKFWVLKSRRLPLGKGQAVKGNGSSPRILMPLG